MEERKENRHLNQHGQAAARTRRHRIDVILRIEFQNRRLLLLRIRTVFHIDGIDFRLQLAHRARRTELLQRQRCCNHAHQNGNQNNANTVIRNNGIEELQKPEQKSAEGDKPNVRTAPAPAPPGTAPWPPPRS